MTNDNRDFADFHLADLHLTDFRFTDFLIVLERLGLLGRGFKGGFCCCCCGCCCCCYLCGFLSFVRIFKFVRISPLGQVGAFRQGF